MQVGPTVEAFDSEDASESERKASGDESECTMQIAVVDPSNWICSASSVEIWNTRTEKELCLKGHKG